MNRQTLLNKYQDTDWRDRQFILAHTLKISREDLIANPDKAVPLWQQLCYWHAIKKRQNNVPLAYILGSQPFYGLNFLVNKHTLIPRPETEQLAEMAFKIIEEKNIKTVIDVGTGSGVIAVVIAKHAPDAKVIGTDISKRALKIADKNASINNVSVKFLLGDLLEPFIKTYNLPPVNCNLVVANLPYLPDSVYEQTEAQVKREPKQALVAGQDGLDYYRELIHQLKQFDELPDCIFECDPSNAGQLSELVEKQFPQKKCEVVKDINNLDRFVVTK